MVMPCGGHEGSRRRGVIGGVCLLVVVSLMAGCTDEPVAAPPPGSTGPSTTAAHVGSSALGSTPSAFTPAQLDAAVGFEDASTELVLRLQAEGLFSAMFAASAGARFASEVASQRASVDEAVVAYRAAAAGVPATPAFTGAGARVDEQLQKVRDLRSAVDRLEMDALEASRAFKDAADAVLAHDESLTAGIDDPRLFRSMTAAANLLAVQIAEGHTATLLSIAVVIGFYASDLPIGPARTAGNTADGTGCDPDPSVVGGSCPVYAEALASNEAMGMSEQRFDAWATGPQKQSKRAADAGVTFDLRKKQAFDDGVARNDLTGAKGGTAIDADEFWRAVDERLTKLSKAHHAIVEDAAREGLEPDDQPPLTLAQMDQILAFVRADANLVRAVEVEGLWSAAFAGSGASRGRDELQAARTKVDAALTDHRNALAALTVREPAFVDATKQADNRLRQVNTIRKSVDGVQNDALGVADQFGSVADDLIALSRGLIFAVRDPRQFRPLWAFLGLLMVGDDEATVSTLLAISISVGFYASQLPGGNIKVAGNPVDGSGVVGPSCNPDPRRSAGRGGCKTYALAAAAAPQLARAEADFDRLATDQLIDMKRAADAGSRLADLKRIAFDDGDGKNDLTGTEGGTRIDLGDYLAAAEDRLAKLLDAEHGVLDLVPR
jgi:hypothetical protein